MMLYVVLTIVMLCRNRFARVLNEMLFFVKYLLVIVGFVALLYIPNEVIVGYARASQYVGVVFLVLQVLYPITLERHPHRPYVPLGYQTGPMVRPRQ